MKLYQLLPLFLMLHACQSVLVPAPVSKPTTSPSNPSPSITPVPSQTPSQPLPIPSASNQMTDCNPDSTKIRLTVYSNLEDRYFGLNQLAPDKRKPIPFAQVKAGETLVSADANGVVVMPRPVPTVSTPIRDQPPQRSVTLEVSAPGYFPQQRTFWNDQLCANQYVALSPLSPAEQAGKSLDTQVYTFTGDLKVLRQNPTTGLYYGVVRTQAQLNALAPSLKAQFQGDPAPQLAQLMMALKEGRIILWLSNGSQGLGDIYNLVQRVTLSGNTAILATHLGVIQQDPLPMFAVGDRFENMIEAVAVPGSVDTLRVETLPYQPESQSKKTLQVPVNGADLPVTSGATSTGTACTAIGEYRGQYFRTQQFQTLCSYTPSYPTGLSGKVLDTTGKPLEDAEVTLTLASNTVGVPIQTLSTRTFADGSFILGAPGRQFNYLFKVSKTGYLSHEESLEYRMVSEGNTPSGQISLPLNITLSTAGN